jgi:UDP-N-acetylmuramoyl-L-alanyl-D-glutamate--2,6-diaminopimelate ligase
MLLSTLLEGLEIESVQGDTHILIEGISHNSQNITRNGLFVAVKGTHQDGHHYLEEAIAAGATATIVEKSLQPRKGVITIKVPDTKIALAHVSDRFYGRPSQELTVIGITGTNGKTTTSYLVESILKAAGHHPGVIGTIDYRFGAQHHTARNTTPDILELQRMTREMVDAHTSHLIMEVSSHALEQHRVEGLHFDVAVFTNLTPEHLDYHGTMAHYSKAKELLFSYYISRSSKDTTYSVINYDDPCGKYLSTVTPAQVIRYGIKEGKEISLKDYRVSSEGLSALIATPYGEMNIRSPLIGSFNLSNILAAIGVAIAIQIPQEAIIQGITQLSVVPGRLERIPNQDGITILVDYAHTSDALDNVLTTLTTLPKKRLITVFGCGGDRDKTKRGPMGDIATKKSDLAIITSDNPRTEDPHAIIEQIEAGIDHSLSQKYAIRKLPDTNHLKGYLIIPERREAIRTAVSFVQPGDILLVAGKGHEDYQIIGTTYSHFSDREELQEALTLRTPRH